MEQSQSAEIFAELVANRVCEKMLVAGGICAMVAGAILFIGSQTMPTFTFEVYKKRT